jgi:hypothetical protein
MIRNRTLLSVARALLCAVLWLGCAPSARAQHGVEEILERMAAHSTWQKRTLIQYEAKRVFWAENKRMNVNATLHVKTTFRRHGGMESEVTGQGGSDFVRGQVFDKILEAEKATSPDGAKRDVDITPANYFFALVGNEVCEDQRPCFRLAITPKREGKYSLKGEIWVDSEDYAIVRIHGSLAKRPSFWTRHTEVDRLYGRINGLWLPCRFESNSQLLIFGLSTLSISYSYNLIETDERRREATACGAVASPGASALRQAIETLPREPSRIGQDAAVPDSPRLPAQ